MQTILLLPRQGLISTALIIWFLLVGQSSGEMPSFSAKAGWQWYKSVLTNHPLATKATTSMILMSFSDILCQKAETAMAKSLVERKGPQVNLQAGCPTNVLADKPNLPELFQQDWKRTSQVAITGLTWSGPISHVWYAVLEAVVRVNNRLLGIFVRILLDAAIFSPIAVAGYFTWRTLLEGGDLKALGDKLSLKWMGALKASWTFWSAANIINFGFVPVHFRVLYNNALSLFWNGFLSHENAKRLENVVDLREARPELFIKGGAQNCELEQAASVAPPCVCSHCRPVRA